MKIFSRIFYTSEELRGCLESLQPDRVFVLSDDRTTALCVPLLRDMGIRYDVEIVVPSGEEHKTLDTVVHIWEELTRNGATRHSLLFNVGGGVVTDMGGFAAATFKRGIPFVHVPTTLMGMVDAAIGGKTGINFDGLKNEVGVFGEAAGIAIYPEFLRTLGREQMLSGYAEMLKHGLVHKERKYYKELLQTPAIEVGKIDTLGSLIVRSIAIKRSLIHKDPYDKDCRRMLNLGHTVGHAFESLALRRAEPVPHGYAVAWGLVCELYLSVVMLHADRKQLQQLVQVVRTLYGGFYFDCTDYEALYELMRHDKKNEGDNVCFTLINKYHTVVIDQVVDKERIFEALDFYRECMGY
ncbi:MAG: 3-dehydroquinate synthase [Prevotellaceae bacterium]|jgi:3-dehydroquinate synthase|nr:3-dehydroquinate synthase [Prevotellaceae bacterium]